MNEEPFRLTDGERMHPLWRRLHAHLQERLADMRKMNDHHMPEAQTSELRGKIAALKAIIALDAEPRHLEEPKATISQLKNF